jgi:hypothetical protein
MENDLPRKDAVKCLDLPDCIRYPDRSINAFASDLIGAVRIAPERCIFNGTWHLRFFRRRQATFCWAGGLANVSFLPQGSAPTHLFHFISLYAANLPAEMGQTTHSVLMTHRVPRTGSLFDETYIVYAFSALLVVTGCLTYANLLNAALLDGLNMNHVPPLSTQNLIRMQFGYRSIRSDRSWRPRSPTQKASRHFHVPDILTKGISIAI